MGRRQWALFSIGMTGMFASGPFCLPNANRHPWLMAIPASFLLLLLGCSLGWLTFSSIRDAWNLRHGVNVVGRVIHARSSGYTNNVPTWEIEAVLPDGTTTHLLVNRRSAFSPGEPISLVVNPRDPAHATLPARPSYDF